MINHQHEISEWVYDNVSHDGLSVMDVDALYCFYKTPGKPLYNIEYKNQNEKIRPTQWFNLPRIERDHGIPYLLFRSIDDKVSIERMTDYCQSKSFLTVSKEKLKKILEDHESFLEIYMFVKNKTDEYIERSRQDH